jgi:hypothetical protein
MGSFVPPEGEILEFSLAKLECQETLFRDLEEKSGCKPDSYKPVKVKSGAIWWVGSSGPTNNRAKVLMDISEPIQGPVAYMSPEEARSLNQNTWQFDGEPMVQLQGMVFPVREKIRKLGGIRHATSNTWWVPKENLRSAEDIVKKG